MRDCIFPKSLLSEDDRSRKSEKDFTKRKVKTGENFEKNPFRPLWCVDFIFPLCQMADCDWSAYTLSGA